MPQNEGDLVRRVGRMLLDELTGGGKRDLSGLRLDDLEAEVFGLADRVSQDVAEGLLRGQAQQTSQKKMVCPCCDGELVSQPARRRTLQMRRGLAEWEEPVWRCPACRRDFFPSVRGDGLCRGSGV